MLSRACRAQRPRPRLDIESLESRTLLSGSAGPTTIGEALFAMSYASLQLRPVATKPKAPSDTSSTTASAPVEGLGRVDQATPPTFLESLNVVTNADGTSAAIIDYRGTERGTYAATARWDNGPAESIDIDQPGEFWHEATVGSAYAMRTVAAGQHSLEVTVTNTDRGVFATSSTAFSIEAIAPDDFPSTSSTSSMSFLEPDAAAVAQVSALGTAPAVVAVYVSGSAWTPAFKSYLEAQGLGHGTYGFAVPDTDQLNELPWTNLDQVSITFSEDVIVDQSQLIVVGSNVSGYNVGGFTYDRNTYTATWTLTSVLAPNATSGDKILLHLSNLVEDLDGERLDGEWANGGSGPQAFPSGNGAMGGTFDFRTNVRPGDVDRDGDVDDVDGTAIRNRFFKSTTNPGTTNPYTPFHDPDGSGTIVAADFSLASARTGAAMPATEPTPPAFAAAPSGLSATAVSDKAINLAWTDNSTDETGFLIDVSFDGTAYAEYVRVGAGVTAIGVTDALPNTTHYFRVAAVNAAGLSPFTAAQALTYPRAPEGMSATEASDAQINVEWDRVDGLAGYTLERSEAGGTWQTAASLPGTAESYQDSGLTGATLYEYRLRATNATGSSTSSEVDSTYTLPRAPSGLVATVASDSQIDLQWSNQSTSATEVVIEGSTYNGDWREFATVSATATSASITSLANGTPYTFRAIARNQSGDSQPSNTASGTTWLWTLQGEASQSGNSISMGTPDRLEGEGQPAGIHGGWVQLAPASAYDLTIHPDLYTWDSYNQDSGSGTGFWDSFSVSITEKPYPEMALLDPLNGKPGFGFIWGGTTWGDMVRETNSNTAAFNLAGNAAKPMYLNVVLDTNTTGQSDGAYPSWGLINVSAPATLPTLPRVSVRASKPQAAEGGSSEAQGEFTFYRDGGNASGDLTVNFSIATGTGQATASDYVSIGSSVIIPDGQRKVTVPIAAFGDSVTNEGDEPVTITLAEDPNHYKLGNTTTQTVTILDKKKYLLAYFGAGTGGFGNEWLGTIVQDVSQEKGYEFILKGENDERGLLREFFSRISHEDNQRQQRQVSEAEAESAEVRMIGYSWGGVQVVNTSRKFTGVDKRFSGYRLKGQLDVESLVTIDPVNNNQHGGKRLNGPVKNNVQKFRNYYQRRRGASTIKAVDAAGFETGASYKFDGRIVGSILSSNFVGSVVDAPDVADKDTKRVDTDFGATPVTRVVGGGSTDIGRLYGNDVNHHTMPWWCYDKAKADLS